MIVFQPVDLERPAVERHGSAACGQATPGGGDQGGAGAGAARIGQANAALPNAQTYMPIGHDLGDADIGALGEQRVGLQLRPERRQIHFLGRIDKKHRVRIADVHRNRRTEAA